MIEVDDAAAVVEWHLKEASRLIEAVRAEACQRAILPFVRHMRDTSRWVEEVLAEAVAHFTETGELDLEMSTKVYVAGASHGSMLMLCRMLGHDPSDHVRLAAASGEIVLGQFNASPERAKVLDMVQRRLAQGA